LGREGSAAPTTGGETGAAVAAGDDHHLVLLGATEEFLAAAFAHALDENLRFATHPRAVGSERKFVLQRNQFVESAQFHLLGHIVGQTLRSVGAGALGILEHER